MTRSIPTLQGESRHPRDPASRAPKISEEDRANAVHGYLRLTDIPAEVFKTARWRRENPDPVFYWEVTHGIVWQRWGYRFYRGECGACGELITMHRKLPLRRTGSVNIGRWPLNCPDCSAAKAAAHYAGARDRMRRLRGGHRIREYQSRK